MNSAKRLAMCTNRFVDILCGNCGYRDKDDPSYVKCSKCDYCNLKEIRVLIDEILGEKSNDKTGSEQADS